MKVKSRSTQPPSTPASEQSRILSEANCRDIATRLARFSHGGGDTVVHLVSRWTGNIRWARNRITTASEDRDNKIFVQRIVQGASGTVSFNDVTDAALVAADRQAERLTQMDKQRTETDVLTRSDSPFHYRDEPFTAPQLFFDSTYQLDASSRAELARRLARSSADAGMLSAGYIEVSATSLASITTWGYVRYYQYTWAQYSVTVRDPKGVGSGWAGVDWPDWNKINGEQLSARALDKCLSSRNPVAVEPGRYTTILESQAVCDFIGKLITNPGIIGRQGNERHSEAPFHKSGDWEPPNIGQMSLALSLLGEKVIDERITLRADPMDPELGFPPFHPSNGGEFEVPVYHPVTWIEHGVLKNLAYDRSYSTDLLGRETGLPNSGAFRMDVSGPMTSMDEMIATTTRGLVVTRFDQVSDPDGPALLCRGYTRDGLWLVEKGKITRPVKNFLFVESITFALNNIEQLGQPQRVFHPPLNWHLVAWYLNPQPVIVPPLKIRDFSFTALSDAV